MRGSGRMRRIRGLVRKEMLQLLRDPSAMIVAFALPLLLLFLFGFGVSLDVNRLRIGLVDESPTPETAWFQASLANSGFFELRVASDRRAFLDDLSAAKIDGVVVLASDFAERVVRGETAPVQVITEGSDPNTAGLVRGYLQGAWQSWLAQRALAEGRPPDDMVTVEPRIWFNPELDSTRFLVPGSIALIQMMIGSLLTALVVAREWERGTIEALLATPAGMFEFIIGKIVPNFLLGLGAMVVSVVTAIAVFDVPLRGSVAALFGITAVFLLVSLGIGLLASTVARTQFVASQIAMLVAFLPGLFFSGFLFEVASMPAPLRAFAAIVPAKYYVQSLQTIFLAGDIGAVLIPAALILGAMALVLMLLTIRSSRTRLD